MIGQGLMQFRHAVATRGRGQDHRNPPVVVAREQGQRALDLVFGAARRPAHIGFGDDDDIGQFHHSRLHELQGIARTGLDAEHDAVDGEGNIGFRLADADAFDQHPVEQSAHQSRRRYRLVGEAAEPVARGHGADENALIFRVRRHARAVAEKRAAGAPRRRIDRDHADRLPARPPVAQQRIGQRRFADARRPGQPRRMGAALRQGGVEQFGEFGRPLMGFNQGQRPRKAAFAGCGDTFDIRERRGHKVPPVLLLGQVNASEAGKSTRTHASLTLQD